MEDSEISSIEKLRGNLDMQLSELDMLESMFCKAGEIKIDDQSTLNDIKEFTRGNTDVPPPYLDLTLNVLIDGIKFETCVSLPHEYPESEPDIFVRNDRLNRTQHTRLNKDLALYLADFKGDPCIFTAASWLQDNALNYVTLEDDVVVEKMRKDERQIRFWIYSHHIYSKSKRREILGLANSLNVTGFCMPGKPGIICVEGDADDCNEWWQTIKSMNWKKIFCKFTEDSKEDSASPFLKFETFEEVIFTNSNIKCNHMDMGELYKFLDDHKCAYIFKDLFGVDNKIST